MPPPRAAAVPIAPMPQDPQPMTVPAPVKKAVVVAPKPRPLAPAQAKASGLEARMVKVERRLQALEDLEELFSEILLMSQTNAAADPPSSPLHLHPKNMPPQRPKEVEVKPVVEPPIKKQRLYDEYSYFDLDNKDDPWGPWGRGMVKPVELPGPHEAMKAEKGLSESEKSEEYETVMTEEYEGEPMVKNEGAVQSAFNRVEGA